MVSLSSRPAKCRQVGAGSLEEAPSPRHAPASPSQRGMRRQPGNEVLGGGSHRHCTAKLANGCHHICYSAQKLGLCEAVLCVEACSLSCIPGWGVHFPCSCCCSSVRRMLRHICGESCKTNVSKFFSMFVLSHGNLCKVLLILYVCVLSALHYASCVLSPKFLQVTNPGAE